MTAHKPLNSETPTEIKVTEEEKTSYLDLLLRKQITTPETGVFNGVLIGWINGLDESGAPLIIAPGFIETPTAARSLCIIQTENINQQCALMFEAGDLNQPLVMGLLQQTVLPLKNNSMQQSNDIQGTNFPTTRHFSAAEEIVFQCGEASLRLLADGQIELRGSQISSHSTGLNHIRGASVKLN